MEIGSVGVNAYAKSNIQSERSQQAQQARQAEQPPRPPVTAEQTEEKRPPVRNAEGQETGRTINTEA